MLSRLLHNYILEQENDAEVQMMGIWSQTGRNISDDYNSASEGKVVIEYDDARCESNARCWLIFDEGQSTYDDARLWNGLFKQPSSPGQNLIIVPFAFYGIP